MCSQETKLRKAESLRSPERLVLAIRYYLAVLPVGQWVELKKPRRPLSRALSGQWNVYLWAARRILQLWVKAKSENELSWRLPENYKEHLYAETGLDLSDPITAQLFKSIPPFFLIRSRNLEAFLAGYPNSFERLRNMLIARYTIRPRCPNRSHGCL